MSPATFTVCCVSVSLLRVSCRVTLTGRWCVTSLTTKVLASRRYSHPVGSSSGFCFFVRLRNKTQLCPPPPHSNNRASCCSTPALPTPWPGAPTASWWAAATRRWWPTAGRVTSCRPSTTTTTTRRRSSRWRPPAPAASRWCLAASTGQSPRSSSFQTKSVRWL